MPPLPTFSREEILRARLNSFVARSFQLPEKDYYSTLSAEAILGLKSVLADINNILTLKVTMAFVDWLVVRMNFEPATKLELQKSVLASKPNSNGFDLWLGYPTALVGEVKCNVPINRGPIYGSAQRHGIEKDIHALLNGKRKASIDPTACLKFMAFLDTPEVRSANSHLIRSSRVCKDKLLFVTNTDELHRHDVVYGVYVSPGA